MSCCAPRSPPTCTRGCRPRGPPMCTSSAAADRPRTSSRPSRPAAPPSDLHTFARRGPAQTKFSPLEARELALPHGVQVVMDPRDLEQISEEDWEAIRADRRTDQVVQTFVKWLEQQQARQAEGA